LDEAFQDKSECGHPVPWASRSPSLTLLYFCLRNFINKNGRIVNANALMNSDFQEAKVSEYCLDLTILQREMKLKNHWEVGETNAT
jgi:hypothetical protein